MPCVLILGARAPVAADIARSLAAAGARVVAADAWRWPTARWSRAVARYVRLPAPRTDPAGFAAAVAEIARSEGVDAIVPLCEEGYWLAALVAARPDLLPPGCRLVAPAAASVARLHDKAAFVATAKHLGLAAPPTRTLASPADVDAVLRAFPAEALVFKPVWSRFATATLVGAPPDVVRRHVRPTQRAPWVAQARVVGRGLCTYSVARDGEVVAHSAYRPEIVYSRAAVVFEAVAHPAAEEWVRRLCAAERLTGQVSFDFIAGVAAPGDDAPRLYAIECNPRATSGAHLWHGGAALGEAMLAAAGLVRSPREVVRPVLGQVAAIKAAVALAAPHWWRDPALRRIAVAAVQQGHDVFRRGGDIGPARAQPLAVAECIGRAIRSGMGFTDAMTVDMRWDGDEVGAFVDVVDVSDVGDAQGVRVA